MKTRLILVAAGALAGYFVTRRRWSLLHNCGAHPLIGVFGERKWVQFLHDSTERKWAESERRKS